MLYTTLALNICINALFRPGKEQAKTLPSKWKKSAPSPAAWNPIPSAETGTSGWRGDFHEIRASSTFYTCCWCCYTGLGWSQKQNLWFPGRLGNVVPESSFLLFFSRDTLLSSVTMPMGLTRYVNKQCILLIGNVSIHLFGQDALFVYKLCYVLWHCRACFSMETLAKFYF